MQPLTPTARRNESAFTLVELLVVILILGILGGFTAAALVTGFNKTTEVDQRVTAYSELQQGGARISRELRAAHLTCAGTVLGPFATSVVVERGGERLRYSFILPSGSKEVTLDVDRWNAGTSSWVDVSSNALVVEVDNHAQGKDLFLFRDADGVATTDPRDVRKIQMNLFRAASGDSVELLQSVSVRNGGLPCPSL